MMICSNNKQKGFVILFAIVMSAAILMIGAGIFSSAIKETILSSTATESQTALFIADTGMECALYNEFALDSAGDFFCGSENLISPNDLGSPSPTIPGLFSYEFEFYFEGTPTCGYVTVRRGDVRTNDEGIPVEGTQIISRGYNLCLGTQPDRGQPTLVERRLEVWYPNVVPVPAPEDE